MIRPETFRLKQLEDGRVEAYENPMPFLRKPSPRLGAKPVNGFPLEPEYEAILKKIGKP